MLPPYLVLASINGFTLIALQQMLASLCPLDTELLEGIRVNATVSSPHGTGLGTKEIQSILP